MTVQVLAPNRQNIQILSQDMETLFYTPNRALFLERLAKLDAQMNRHSLMLRLEYQGRKILLPGDTNCAGYSGISPDALRADIFKVGHHGQRDGADAALLERIRPEWVICCASSDRRYQSADPELMKELAAMGHRCFFRIIRPCRPD